jgi:hypothetical protein
MDIEEAPIAMREWKRRIEKEGRKARAKARVSRRRTGAGVGQGGSFFVKNSRGKSGKPSWPRRCQSGHEALAGYTPPPNWGPKSQKSAFSSDALKTGG